MIAELVVVDDISTSDQAEYYQDALKNAFARTRYEIRSPLARSKTQLTRRVEERTLSLNPQHAPGFFPIPEGSLFDKPRCRTLVLGTACNVVILRRIWRREPFCEFLFQLIPCKK